MRKYLPIVLLVGVAAVFAFGVAELFELRFEAGDVYPPYSSLRSDPLGAMALYESLGRLPGVSVRRDYSASNRLPEEPDTVYLHLSASDYEWEWVPGDLFREIQGFLARGGRLIIAYSPRTEKPLDFQEHREAVTNSMKAVVWQASKDEDDKNKKMTRPKDDRDSDFEEADVDVSLTERWGFHTDFRVAQDVGTSGEIRVQDESDLPLPHSLEWHSGLVFTRLDKAWQTIYSRGNEAVVMERRFGPGSVVMATDSYYFSNEAMEKDRQAAFLAWLIGPARHVVFDEAHLGVVETPGVAGLMRKYRLYWLGAGLLLLAGLFIWKNASSLVPRHEAEERPDHVLGKDAASGFVNLLRRNVAGHQMLETCFIEWKKSAPGQYSAARLQQAETAFQTYRSSKDRDPLTIYRNLCTILKTRNRR